MVPQKEEINLTIFVVCLACLLTARIGIIHPRRILIIRPTDWVMAKGPDDQLNDLDVTTITARPPPAPLLWTARGLALTAFVIALYLSWKVSISGQLAGCGPLRQPHARQRRRLPR